MNAYTSTAFALQGKLPLSTHPETDASALLEQLSALLAVVRNGIEAAPRDGWVRVGCSSAPAGIRFTVDDSGPGLTAEALEHAFDPFYCGREAGRGRGLGLSTAWQLARQNGGSVRYEPATGGPTRFVLTVPLAISGPDRAARKSA